jgi:hypothetical protein
VLLERVSEAQRIAARELREMQLGKGRGKKRGRPGTEGGEGGEAESTTKAWAGGQQGKHHKGPGGNKHHKGPGGNKHRR